VQASFRCESCNRVSDDLVKACVNLRGGSSERMYPHHIHYVERCENCGAQDPKWVRDLLTGFEFGPAMFAAIPAEARLVTITKNISNVTLF